MSNFVICIKNENNTGSLLLGEVYSPLSDAEAEPCGMFRVVDEDKPETDGYMYLASMKGVMTMRI